MSTDGPFPDRTYGVLLHPTSFPGRDGIGTLGAEAAAFVEWLATTGAGIWQTLPMTINGRDESPYFSSSSFAGNPWLVDLDLLHADGLVDLPDRPDRIDAARVDYASMRTRKRPVLWAAADRFLAERGHPWRSGFDEFVREAGWLTETCHFFARQEAEGGAPWWEWPQALRRRDPDAVTDSRRALADQIARWEAVLFFFELQWRGLRDDANHRGILVLGDLPIYVAPDSADVWLHQDQFQLDDDGRPTVQAGVPPDYFSATGQLWGNPLYRWDVMADDGYEWWLSRLRRALELSDIVRIDHFRALSSYWEVAAGAENAVDGRWVSGPGQHFLDAVRSAFPTMPFVAEDLGTLDDDVLTLRDANGLPGMRILQFGFDGLPDNPHRPDRFPEQCVAYTGTHDNNTVAGWWQELSADERRTIARYFRFPVDADIGRVVWSFVDALIASRAIAAVVPMQDLLVLDGSARMNVPSTTEGNWSWRMPSGALTADLAHSMRRLCERSARC